MGKLGTIAFGGPAVHVAMVRDETVRRRHWLEDAEFLDLFGAVSVLPGPSSTQLAIVLSRRRAGWAGLVLGGACFILPAMAIVLVILATAGLVVTLAANWRRLRPTAQLLLPSLPVGLLTAPVPARPHPGPGLAPIAGEFLKLGVVVFGSGYVLLAFLRRDLVGELGWLSTRQVLDAVVAGQATPGRCSPPPPSSATCSAASPPPWSRPPRSSCPRS